MIRGRAPRPVGVAVGLVVARFTPEPPDDAHPVALFGRLMTSVERRLWRDDRRAGVAYAAIGTTVGAVAGLFTGGVATATAVAVAGRQLRRVAGQVADRLDDGDLEGARQVLHELVGRDTATLDAAGVSAAAIESVAENTVDAVVGPALWGVAAGAPGVFGYRAVNTMDAMVGHRTARHERFGWAAARLDDGANLVPARVFAVIVAACSRGRAGEVWRAVRRDAAAHPSPNAGVAEAAMAAALGCELGGPLTYAGRREDRPLLGSGPRPGAHDIRRAVQLADRVEVVLIGALLLLGASVAVTGAVAGRSGRP